MRVDDEVRGQLATRFEVLLPHLNERQQRLALGCEARLLGHGGVAAVAAAAGVSPTTVRRGADELDSVEQPLPVGRSRLPGGGRKPLTEHDPELVSALLTLVEPDERGDPMSPLRWTTKSLRHLAAELTARGHPVSAPTVGHLLRANGFSLQGTAKTLEGAQHPDRDRQFRYINEQVKVHQADGEPVVSVDAKKKEQLGQLPAAGRDWRPQGEPVQVEDHSFFSMGPETPLAIPYGVYDLTTDAGWVNVGIDHDTSAFAVASIRRWWAARGHADYPGAHRLLITADAGGSNSYRYRLWKAELAALAADTGLAITVCHFPPGTSNVYSRQICSMNVLSDLLGVNANSIGQAIAETRQLLVEHGRTIAPTTLRFATAAALTEFGSGSGAQLTRPQLPALLGDPALTGMARADLAALTERVLPILAARNERHRHRRRGGERLPGARGGVFTQKLTDAERVLAAVLYQRGLCSHETLAELFEVSRRTLGTAAREVAVVLEQVGHVPVPAQQRFATATALLASVAIPEPATDAPTT
jgi:hypothetical protein